MKNENPASVLAKMRWSKTSKKERTAHARKMNAASQKSRKIGINRVNAT